MSRMSQTSLPNVAPMRRKHGLRWVGKTPPYKAVIRTVTPWVMALLLVVAAEKLLTYEAQAQLLDKEKQQAVASEQTAWQRLAHCLNGGAFKVGDGAIKCVLPISQGV